MTYHGEAPTIDGDYTVVRFLQSGDFVAPYGVALADVLIVAGGGGGSLGGGGAGGVLQLEDVALSGAMAVVVGSGGAGTSNDGGSRGEAGGASSFAGNTAAGGGGGGCSTYSSGAGGAGGSGGGGSGGSANTTGGAASPSGQGNAGGSKTGFGTSPYPACGGGGAGATGSGPAGASTAGAGGAGITWNGLSVGGGGGGGVYADGTGGTASHGGGAGAANASGTAGTANTGGGGGGGGQGAATGGAGGSGIVVLRFLTPPSFVATGGTITTDGDYVVHTFTADDDLVCYGEMGADTSALLVGGGGSGDVGKTATYLSGGGGGGQVVALDTPTLTGKMPVVVGAGGAAVSTVDVNGNDGGASTFAGSTAAGGKGAPYNTGKGGDCGGAAYTGGNPNSIRCGGGAGAGQNGGDASAGALGVGGNGAQSSISGAATYYGGGGGAGQWSQGLATAAGGLGGGGAGRASGTGTETGTAGTDGLGGGGGGGGSDGSTHRASGKGGNGVVIVRYLAPAFRAYGGTVTRDGDYVVHTFTSGGTLRCAGTVEADVLIVGGGGGGGGGTRGAGAGAGGVAEQSSVQVSGSLPVTIGAGGAKGAWSTSPGDDTHGATGGKSGLGGASLDDLLPTMTDYTAPSGTASASGYYGNWYPWKAFNDGPLTNEDGWLVAATSGWLQYQFPTAKTVRAYAIRLIGVSPTRSLKSWQLQGSNDGAAWTTLDTQSNVTDWDATPKARRILQIASPGSYIYYRVNVTASNDATYVAIGELQFFESWLAEGGGWGDAGDGHVGGSGASGGGAWYTSAAGGRVWNQGNVGGLGTSTSNYGAGGGGGAGAAGGNGSGGSGGNGGSGVQSSITGSATYYGGGGSGDTWGGSGSRAAGTAGQGGGGTGDNHNSSQNTAGCGGTANTGGGGGANGDGGSGVVIVRYLMPSSGELCELSGDMTLDVSIEGDLRTFVAVETDAAGLNVRVDLEGELHVGAATQTLAGTLSTEVILGGFLVVGPPLPATDWTTVDVVADPELLRDLRVRLATLDGEYVTVDPAEISQLVIKLSRKCGVESIELRLNRDARREFGDLDYGTKCEVEYLGRVMQGFIRESELSHESRAMTRPTRMLGPIAKLSERHEAFRKVYVDSRLGAWKTDQGPQTGASVWETSAQ